MWTLGPRTIIGTAGWSIPRNAASACPTAGTHLERYARTFDGAEINSSFYRPHTAKTYARWAAATPEDFRFAVKVPRAITHDQALRRPRTLFTRFLEETSGLGEKRGPILVQLSPSHAFDARVVGRFFAGVREIYPGPIVCEPRHASWFTAKVDRLLDGFRVSRVAADPARVPAAAEPGGWRGLVYYRLHGSPRTYWSRYSEPFIADLARAMASAGASRETWCVFDNTASGAAVENAFELQQALRP